MRFAHIAASALGAAALFAAGSAVAATFLGPTFPAPGGTTFVGAGSRISSTGFVGTYTGFDLTQTDDLYFGIAGALSMDGPVNAADALTFNAALSNLALGQAVYTGTTLISANGIRSVDTKLVLNFTDLAGNGLALTNASAAGFSTASLGNVSSGSDLPVLNVTGDFKVQQFYQARFTGSGGGFVAAGAFYDGQPTTGSQLFQSTSGGFYYTEATAGGIPEPASWALMISGFGAAGSLLRRRRSVLA
jgi:hypothetical protein